MSMFDLTQLNDDDLRAALFDAVVERFDAQAQQDRSIAIVNRMPTVVAVSRRGNLLTLSQGLGPWLLRGDLKCRDRRERLKTFNVGRATLQSRLAITPDRIEGTPDEILDRIVAMFLESTAGGEESENRSVQERRPAVARTSRESRRATVEVRPPTSIEVTEDSSPVLQMPDQTISVEAVPPPPDPFQEKTRSALRTYQMLFETARRELDQAQSLPAGNRYFLLSAGVFVALSAEAFFNDLGSRVIPSWSQLQRLDPREKAEVLSIELFNDKVDWSVRPFQSVAAALGFRRALAHAHAETLSYEETRTVDRRASEVPRTRRTAWPEYCDVATIQRWIADVRLVIEYFSRGHDPTEV
jgi:hypothetical protein